MENDSAVVVVVDARWRRAGASLRSMCPTSSPAIHAHNTNQSKITATFPIRHLLEIYSPTYEFLVIVVLLLLLLSVLRVDLHGFVNEVDRFPRSRGRILVIATRGLFGLPVLQLGEVLQRELEQIPGLAPQHFHGKAL